MPLPAAQRKRFILMSTPTPPAVIPYVFGYETKVLSYCAFPFISVIATEYR